ncbi:MAG: peroxide stress protein YaaA [Bacteroidota bacterium]|jgi:cytoplasmic iron level regulating protein YaaA (DUF328/UPF0246 family)|nr:peroxide stress protein YaaA [Algoriphagus sp.]
MLIVLSPSKTLDFSPISQTFSTSPDFQAEVNDLVSVLQKKSSTQLGKLMHLSDALASLNASRYATFSQNLEDGQSKQALLAFKGDVYTKMDVDTYTKEDLHFAQEHLRILSGLYGLLKPLDLIQAYRLEMGTRLKTKKGASLYEFWGTKISKALNEAGQGKTLVNLASQEYFKAVDKKALKLPVVHIHFKEYKNGSYQVVGLFAKQARGLMSDYAIKNRITSPEELKGFQRERYEFAESQSGPQDWVFVR